MFEANKLYQALQNYNANVLLFPMDDFLTSEALAISPELKITRLETLNELINNVSDNASEWLLNELYNQRDYYQNKYLINKGLI